jgi:hypothetical protein
MHCIIGQFKDIEYIVQENRMFYVIKEKLLNCFFYVNFKYSWIIFNSNVLCH